MQAQNDLEIEQALMRNNRKRKAVFIIFGLLFLLIISAVVDAFLYEQRQQMNNLNLVSFLCRPLRSNQTFTIGVNVNLTDSMDEDEAFEVALELYTKVVRWHITGQTSFSSTVLLCADGSWFVEFYVAYPISSYCAQRRHVRTRIVRETFVASINPFVRTVEYSRT